MDGRGAGPVAAQQPGRAEAELDAFGVLLDTIVTRSILVPSLVADLGDRVWWPWAGRIAADEPRE